MTRAGPIRVLIAEDHAEYRAAIALVIERAEGLELAGTAADAAEAIQLAALARPDVALLDVRMPGGGGAAAVRGIAERSPDTRMIAVSAAEYSDEALDRGVVAHLLKSTSVADIVEAVKRAADTPAGVRRSPAAPDAETSIERTPPCSAAARILQSGYSQREGIEQLLHDRVQSGLAALRVHLGLPSGANGSEMAPHRDDMVAEVDALIDDARGLAAEIYPRVLATHGLGAALRMIARESGIAVAVSPREVRRLPRGVEDTIYFYCRDLVRLAALRVGERGVVRIRVADVDGSVRCSVVVQGPGTAIDAFPVKDDFVALSDPVAGMGGTVRVAPGAPGGVCIVADLPVQVARPESRG